MKSDRNIVLIGMPGSGKSTVGVLLAKRLCRQFLDTDLIVQTAFGRSLQQIVDEDGYVELRRMEEKAILGLSCCNHVVATGGSAVYSSAAMDHLRHDGIIVFLDVEAATLASRIADFDTRGLSKRKEQTLGDLFVERLPLYRAHAEIVVECSNLSAEETCREIAREIARRGIE